MPVRTLLPFGFALFVAVAFTFADYVVLGDIIPNRGPSWTAYGILKTIVALGVAAMIVASVYADGRAGRGTVAPSVDAPRLVMLSYLLAAAFVLLFLVSPTAFNWLSLEDNIVEYLSAFLCLGGSALFVGAFLAARHLPPGGPDRRLVVALASLGAVALFLIGMEEVSWFQRILGFSTPESFAANRQGEVNLHNFFTTPVHSIYRVGSWAALILLPFMAMFGPKLRLLDALGDFVPPPWVVAMSAPVACFNYNAWPFMPTQVVVFSSIMMMTLFALHARRAGLQEAALLFGAGTALMIVVQAVFLIGGERFVRHWDVTEYQEFFMALGLAAIAWAARERIRMRSLQRRPGLAPNVVKP